MLLEGRPLTRPVGPLENLLAVGLAADREATALSSAERDLTWAQLEELATRLAAQYRRLGLAPGDRLASLLPNRDTLAVHYLACYKAGIVAVPLNYRYTAPEIDHALQVSDAAALVAHAERAEDLATSKQVASLGVGVISVEGEIAGAAAALIELLEEPPPERAFPPNDPSAPAVIFFTSGSTGPAKGVTHSHLGLRWLVASTIDAFELTPQDLFLPASSMSHMGSFMWTLATLAVGAEVVVARSYDSYEVLPLLRQKRPTVMAMLPAALIALVRSPDVTHDDFACLRVCRSGSDKVSTELLREFAAVAGFPIDEGYGMTEVGLATLNPPSGPIKQGSIGRAVGGFSLDVRDEQDQTVPTGTVGRLWIRTAGQMTGYWQNPEATAQVVREGWLDSGDLAHADDEGYLWFFGRKKQLIVHDGSNISPFEVEGSLMEHPGVALAGVVGIHDTVHGENVRAYVTLRPGSPSVTSDELILYSRSRVGYKAPEEIVFLDEIPLNPTGKLDRVALKRLAEDHLHPHGLP